MLNNTYAGSHKHAVDVFEDSLEYIQSINDDEVFYLECLENLCNTTKFDSNDFKEGE